MKAILLEGSWVGLAKQSLLVGFIVSEQPGTSLVTVHGVAAQPRNCSSDQPITLEPHGLAHLVGIAPRPGVTHPKGGKQGQRSGIGAPVGGLDSDQNVGWRSLGILNNDVEIAIFSKNTRINKFVL